MHTIPYSSRNLYDTNDDDDGAKKKSDKQTKENETMSYGGVELKVWIFLLLFAFIKICVFAAVVCRNYFIYGMMF